MEEFRIKIKKGALKSVNKYQEYKSKLIDLFVTLKRNPLPYREYDLVKLKGYEQVYRVRLGKLRVIYQIDWTNKTITILVVAKRSAAYKSL